MEVGAALMSDYIESPGRWCTPKSQMPGWPFDRYYPDGILAPEKPVYFPPIPRGGIKYPPVTEEARMKSLENQLADLRQTQLKLNKQIEDVAAQIKAAQTLPPPPAEQAMWSINVRFSPGGRAYRFLILRVGDRFFTTGTGDQSRFESWRELVDWLGTVHEHGPLRPLRTDFEGAVALDVRAG